MPVARKVWQVMRLLRPMAAARRWIMRQASIRCMALSVSVPLCHTAERKRALAAVTDTGHVEVGVEIGVERMMRRHLVALAAFFMQPDPPTLALGVVVLDAHRHHGADAGEGEDHHAE